MEAEEVLTAVVFEATILIEEGILSVLGGAAKTKAKKSYMTVGYS